MNTYKITNITNLSGKRDFKHNSPLEISYVNNLTTKKIIIKAGESIYLTAKTLPLSAHKLRVKNLITVVEVSKTEMANLLIKPTDKIESKKNVKIKEKPTKAKKKEINKE